VDGRIIKINYSSKREILNGSFIQADYNCQQSRAIKLEQYMIVSIDKEMFIYNDNLDSQIISNMINNKEIIYATLDKNNKLIITGKQPDNILLFRIFNEGTISNREFYTCLAARANDTDILDINEQNHWIQQYENDNVFQKMYMKE
jgi:hypothetical protein